MGDNLAVLDSQNRPILGTGSKGNIYRIDSDLVSTLLINAAPGYLTGPLEVITTRNGDCKSHSIAKYAAARAAGFSADHVRLVTVHDRRHNFDHMVAVVYYNEEWLILDNLTNLLVRDSEKRDYEPMAVLDYKGVRRYHSAFWMID